MSILKVKYPVTEQELIPSVSSIFTLSMSVYKREMYTIDMLIDALKDLPAEAEIVFEDNDGQMCRVIGIEPYTDGQGAITLKVC